MIQYNDYELLYLMNEFDEEAETTRGTFPVK